MKWFLICSLLLVALVVADEEVEEVEEVEEIEELPLADVCDPEQCKLPDCLCSSTNIPGGLAPRDTPQFVTVTFDDGINTENTGTYRSLLYGRSNSNGCPASATFFVNHEYTDYTLVNELYNNGFEIALHSITHQTPQTYWAQATYEIMVQEFSDQKVQMAHFANIPIDQLKGMRIPFLQLAGNASYQMMAGHGLVYDSSWSTITFTNPGLWPYTLDFASIQDCQVQPCPSASIPGVWVAPMVAWTDLDGFPCAMVDSCFSNPNTTDEEAWFRYILTNFERHYQGNRAPFGFYIHEWYVRTNPAVQRALHRFLNLVNNLQDAFMVNANEVIDWVKNPLPIDEYRRQSCRDFPNRACAARTCPLIAEHNMMEYYMSVCTTCPRSYPWIGNPLGN